MDLLKEIIVMFIFVNVIYVELRIDVILMLLGYEIVEIVLL